MSHGEVQMYSKDETRSIMETSRDHLERLEHFRLSEPVITTKEWHRVPEPEPEPQRRRLDTNPNAYLEQQVEWLTSHLAEILPAIDTFMKNVNQSWSELKCRIETAEKKLEEVNNRLADIKRAHELDLRDVKLSIREERNGS